ncbi:toll/interleukin-1 receptor domain-containing protein [Clostridium estertheticum]|uniref:toll/interleukin-1 receptor domain-containing protein n=1 Tax=Clostridium estertheticum TaxID=238834 RepID=UPI001C0E4925|nr:toll/interleukin-1 receptor domain-containing protein [Clostridium estertheticum]MBU3185683.1 toll/interleukin-1 receptor domain-containing protein [Clostridium estertheticum]
MPEDATRMIYKEYTKIVKAKYPLLVDRWPLIAGYNVMGGQFNNYLITIFKNTGNKATVSSSGINFSSATLGISDINDTNIETLRLRVVKDYGLQPRDSVVVLKIDGSNLNLELQKLLQKHEVVMGVIGMKIFLSHKGIDKSKVRDFKNTLELIGFEPWLDEDAMNAGVELERGIKQGFTDSCAAVFFVTPNFVDESYLSSEVNYAIMEKRKKKEKFSIITLVFEENGVNGTVPELLEPYVWKVPKTDLEAIREIIKALPLRIGDIYYK